jgi:hypothetical protein
VPSSPLLEKHTALGDTLLPWAAGMFVFAAAVWWLGRRQAVVDDSLPNGSDECRRLSTSRQPCSRP